MAVEDGGFASVVLSRKEMYLNKFEPVFDYMKNVNCIFLCVILIGEVIPMYCERDLVTWTLPFVFFNPTTKNDVEALRMF
jgi:hypothetical protein